MPKKRVFLGTRRAQGPEPAGGVLQCGLTDPRINPTPGTGTAPEIPKLVPTSAPVPPDAVPAGTGASCGSRSTCSRSAGGFLFGSFSFPLFRVSGKGSAQPLGTWR